MTYAPDRMRTIVIDRAGGCCGYCRVSQASSDVAFHIEHIIAVSHGGKTESDNLALSCLRCNLYKVRTSPQRTHSHVSQPFCFTPDVIGGRNISI